MFPIPIDEDWGGGSTRLRCPHIHLGALTRLDDRNNIAAAKLAGLQEELNLSSVEFETAVSILFVGYLLMQIPSNLLLNKFGKPAIYLPSCVGPRHPTRELRVCSAHPARAR